MVKDVVGKARCPKKYEKGSGWKGGKTNKNKKYLQPRRKVNGLKTKNQKLFFEIYLKNQKLNLYNFKNTGLFFSNKGLFFLQIRVFFLQIRVFFFANKGLFFCEKSLVRV